MTADFYQTISMKPFDFEPNDDVFGDESKINKDPFDHCDVKMNTVTTITYDNNEDDGGGGGGGDVFDPFATIHDDEATISSKRSSIEHGQMKDCTEMSNDNDNGTVSKSAKAKELFNSSMAGIELLATTNIPPSASSEFSPLTPATPVSGCDNAFLSAPQGMDMYSSDLSDMSDVSPTTANDVRSAFNMYSGTCLLFT